MFKNNLFAESTDFGEWFRASAIRALKTFCQTAVSLITIGSMITELNWVEIASISATSAIVSILTSVAGIPEVKGEE